MKTGFLSNVLLFSLPLLVTVSAWAQDIDDAVHAMREGNFAEAYCIMRPLADNGDAEAQYNIGWMYLNGYGLTVNDNLALEWWQRASDQGYVDATFSMAMLYGLGEGQVKKDMNRAIDLYLKAAEAGHEDARMIVKSMLQRNDRAIRDRKQNIINNHANMLGDFKQVRVKRANIRSGPGLDQAIVASAEQGVLVVVLSEKGSWSQVAIKNDGIIAWVYTSLLEVTETKEGEVVPTKDENIFEDEVSEF